MQNMYNRIIHQGFIVVSSIYLLKVILYTINSEYNFQLLPFIINKINECLLGIHHLKENTLLLENGASPKHLCNLIENTEFAQGNAN